MLTIIRCLSFAFILGGSFYFGRLGQSVETVQITDRGNPVARLVPLEAGTKEFDESWLAEMERLGNIRRPRRPPPKKRQAPAKPKHRVDAVRLTAVDREGR